MECYDVMILGSGLAGLYAALNLSRGNPALRLLMLSKQAPDISSSSLAQGGVAAVLEAENDSTALHLEDTLIAGSYKNDVAAVEVLVSEGPEDVRRVMALGVEFDKTPDGALAKTLEGGHSRRRIVHCADHTGKEMVDKLLPRVLALPNFTLLEDAAAYHAKKTGEGFLVDAVVGEEAARFACRYLLLCTGGIGQVYAHTTNPVVSTGDGIRLAYELGAEIRHMRLVQFHPTAFRNQESGNRNQESGDRNQEQEAGRTPDPCSLIPDSFRNTPDPCSLTPDSYLISEAVRGEGAYLLNHARERFMERYDPRLELAPRDVVSRAILREAARTGSEEFFLDIRHRGRAFLLARFPGIAAACLARGVDIAADLIPVFPCQHYLMGGIHVDLQSRTSVPGLYAAGECAQTGLHGGNRLASNSLPEALVFSRRAAEDILRNVQCTMHNVQFCDDSRETVESVPRAARNLQLTKRRIQQTMQKACFVFPNEELLPGAAREMRALYEELLAEGYAPARESAETLSLACVAALVLEDTLQNMEDFACCPGISRTK